MTVGEHIDEYEAASREQIELTGQEARLCDERDQRTRTIMESLVGNPNPLTGKAHSATSAEAVAKADAEVIRCDADLIEVRRDRALAAMRAESARMRTYLFIATAGIPEAVQVEA